MTLKHNTCMQRVHVLHINRLVIITSSSFILSIHHLYLFYLVALGHMAILIYFHP